MSADDHLTTDEIRALDRAHVLHSWSTQSQIDPLVIAGGEGSRFRTSDGARYLDFASLVVNANLGHQHPRVTEAIAAQAYRLCATAPAMTDEMRVRLAALLAEVTPGDLTMSFFTNGGAEATENAIKLARWYTGRHKIVARYRSYHGATAGAVSVTGDPRRWAAEPGIPGVVPDIMTVAKGITSGYLPLGAMIVNRRLADWLQDHEFTGGLTSTGNPLCCAAGCATVETLREEKVVENAAAMGAVLAEELPRLAGRHPSVGEVRGLGLLWALELVKDRVTREPLVPFNAKGAAAGPMRRLSGAALARGLYLMTHFNLVLVAPPLTITRAELDEGVATLDDVLSEADAEAAAG